jgi:hypothetical protein
VAAFIIGPLVPWHAVHEDQALAAWVQAAGSVIAVGAGAAAVWWQVREQQRIAARQFMIGRWQQLRSIVEVIEAVQERVDEACRSLATSDDFATFVLKEVEHGTTRHLAEVIEGVELSEIPFVGLRVAFLQARSVFRQFDDQVGRAWQIVGPLQAFPGAVSDVRKATELLDLQTKLEAALLKFREHVDFLEDRLAG